MEIRYANLADIDFLKKNDTHISQNILEEKLRNNTIILITKNNDSKGFLRFGLFWDEIPIMNMLYIKSSERKKGFGRQLVFFWEEEMKKVGFTQVMTSTQENEQAQHFYRKLGYTDIGKFKIPNDANEIILHKTL